MRSLAHGGRIMSPNGPGAPIRHRFYVRAQVVLALMLCCCANITSGLPLDEFYPFSLTDDNRTPKTDDGGSPVINLSVNFTFFNRTDLGQLYVNNNGIISFLRVLSSYKPINFNEITKESLIPPPVVAPFWSDIDIFMITEGNFSEAVLYRLTNDSEILTRASEDVRREFIGQNNFSAAEVLIVTWYNVGYYGATSTGKLKRNLFQTVLITDGEASFIIFNYNKIVWTTGANSVGDTVTGLGGYAAVVGFHSGTPDSYYLMPNSGLASIINISQESNIGVPGKFIFRVDGDINDLSCRQLSDLQINPRSMSMLGGEVLEIIGPCFDPSVTAMAHFPELDISFPCQVTGEHSALCVTPSVFRTGKLLLSIDPKGSNNWQLSTVIQSENLLTVPAGLVRLDAQGDDDWTVGAKVKVSWDSDQVPSSASRRWLEVLGYSSNPALPEFQSTKNYTVGNGVTSKKFTLLSEYPYNSLVIRLCWEDPELVNTLPPCIWSDVFPVRWNSEAESESWCESWLEADRRLSPLQVREPFCPCKMTTAGNDLGHFTRDPICDINPTIYTTTNCVFNPGAIQCFRRNIKSPTDDGETCCYDQDGQLMDDFREYKGAGTHQRYHYKSQGNEIVPFFSYFEEDVLPKLHCCSYSDRNCSQFVAQRPETSCSGYSPPSAAQAAGDPHLVTLDGQNYSFNGLGDYFLLTDSSETLAVQVRAVQAINDKGVLQNATIFTSVAVAIPGVSDTVEMRLTETGYDVLVNGQLRTDTTSQFNNISLSSTPDGSHVIVLEPVSVSVLVTVTPDLLNIMALIGEPSLQGNLRGLLGNYNGDPSDDFIPRNSNRSIPVTSPMREIHYDFGLTWLVQPNESILSSPTPQTLSDAPYSPVFLDELDIALPADVTTVCDDNEQCKFDYAVTNKISVAMATKSFSEKFEALKSDLEEKVVRCPYLDIPAHGNKTSDGRSEGSVERFTCDVGYELNGDSERVCQADATWTGSSASCVVKVERGTDNIFGVILAVSLSATGGVVIIVVAVFLFFCHRRRRRKPTETDIELPEIRNIPVFDNPTFMHSLHTLTKDGRFKIPRPNFVDPSIFQEYF